MSRFVILLPWAITPMIDLQKSSAITARGAPNERLETHPDATTGKNGSPRQMHGLLIKAVVLCVAAGLTGCPTAPKMTQPPKTQPFPTVPEPKLAPEDESAVQLLVGGRRLARTRLARTASQLAAANVDSLPPADPQAAQAAPSVGESKGEALDMTAVCNIAYSNLLSIAREETRRKLEKNDATQQEMDSNLSVYDAEREADRPIFVERCLAGPRDKPICAAKALTLKDLQECGPAPQGAFDAPSTPNPIP
jgi:hypothetical protein